MNLLIRFALYTIIALVPVGCGMRKVESEKLKIETKNTNESSNEGNSDKYQSISTQEEALNTNKTTNKTVETIKTKEYDSATGKLLKEQESTKTGDYSEIRINRLKTVTNNVLHEIEKWKIKNKVITHTVTNWKTKKSTSERNGLYYLGGFGLLILGVLAWLKRIR